MSEQMLETHEGPFMVWKWDGQLESLQQFRGPLLAAMDQYGLQIEKYNAHAEYSAYGAHGSADCTIWATRRADRKVFDVRLRPDEWLVFVLGPGLSVTEMVAVTPRVGDILFGAREEPVIKVNETGPRQGITA